MKEIDLNEYVTEKLTKAIEDAVIQEAMNDCRKIKCRVKDEYEEEWNKKPVWIVAFDEESSYPYMDIDGLLWRFAKPIKKEIPGSKY